MQVDQPEPSCPNLWVYSEKNGTRQAVFAAVCSAVKDHLIGLNVIERLGGFPKAAAVIRNRLPTKKKIRSGDLGEILATEYISQKTGFTVPVKRLRYKDDRDMAMRGDDVLGLMRTASAVPQVLKTEVKSRKTLGQTTVGEACTALLKNSGRPNPSTLAFISVRLREEGRDLEAQIIEALQEQEVKLSNVEHLVFTFSGNQPSSALSKHATAPPRKPKRTLVGFVVPDHQEFIQSVFEAIDGGKL